MTPRTGCRVGLRSPYNIINYKALKGRRCLHDLVKYGNYTNIKKINIKRYYRRAAKKNSDINPNRKEVRERKESYNLVI